MKNKIFTLIIVLVSIFVGILLLTISLRQNTTISSMSVKQLDSKKRERKDLFDDFINTNRRLVESLKINKDVKKYFKTGEGKDTVKNIFMSYSYLHNNIFQIRYIDKNGKEVIRVDNNGQPIIILDGELQNKKNRYYFLDTFNLKEDEIYYSDIDLNKEKGKIQKPIVPTLRIGTPIIVNNEKKGILIININVSGFLEKLQDSSLHHVSLIYENGDILVSNNSNYNWSKDFALEVDLFKIYPFLSKEFNKLEELKTKEYYLSKLSIDTKNKIFMLLLPKEFKEVNDSNNTVDNMVYLLIAILLTFIPIGYFIGIYFDKLYQKEVSFEVLKTEKNLIHSLINATDDLISYKDNTFNYIGCNIAFEKFVGRSESEIIGKSDFDLFEEQNALLFREMDTKMLASNKIRLNDEWGIYPYNKKVFFHTKKIPFEYSKTESLGILAISRDITKLHKAQLKIEEESLVDELTKAQNRKAYNKKIHQEVDLFKRYNTKFCMAMYDIDNFKEINDTYGHDIGDKVLFEMTQLVESNIRSTDSLFRVGGEEFIIIFSSSKVEETKIVIEKIRLLISEMKVIDNRNITVSIGFTEVIKENEDGIYKRVDKLLYLSKNTGKNKTTFG